MQAIQNYLFRVQDYPEVLAHHRAKGLFLINWLQLIMFILGLVAIAFRWITVQTLPSIELRIVYGILFACAVFIHVTLQSYRWQLAAITLVLELTFTFLFYLPFWEGISNFNSILLFLPLIATGTLIPSRSLRVTLGIMLAAIVLAAGLIQSNSADATLRGLATIHTFLLLIAGGAAWVFLEVFRASEIQQISSYVEKTSETLLWLNDNKHDDYIRLSETEIIDHALRRIQERFAADYLCMYLTNDEGIIDRRILNDPRIKSEPESVNIQQNSVLLQAIRKAGPTTIQNNSSYQNHLSDRAKTAILFPMRTDEQTIGILDIQFINNPLGSIVDQNTIQAIATRLADTLSKSRYLTQIREHLNEQEITAKRLEAQLLTIQTQRKDTIDTFWGDYVEQRGIHAFGFDIRNQRIIPANEVSDSMKVALENKDIYIATEADGKTLNVPIQVRDRVLGALAFTVSMDQNLTERQIETVQTIANRLGTALENVRLLEQTQAQAIRERKAGESANVLIGATDINSLIQIAADNFNDTLGAIQTRIYLEPNVNSPSRSEHPRGLNGNQLSNGTKSETGA